MKIIKSRIYRAHFDVDTDNITDETPFSCIVIADDLPKALAKVKRAHPKETVSSMFSETLGSYRSPKPETILL